MAEKSRKADPQLQYFVDFMRESLGMERLYNTRPREEIERFYRPLPQFSQATPRRSVY